MSKYILIIFFSLLIIILSVGLYLLLQTTDKVIEKNVMKKVNILQEKVNSKTSNKKWIDKMAKFKENNYTFPVNELNLEINLREK